MKDLIKKLRDLADNTVLTGVYSACTAAADTIEDLQTKLDRVPETEPSERYFEMLLDATRAELKEVEAVREKDYAAMREFQAKFIEADQERIALKSDNEQLKSDIISLKAQLVASFDREIKLKKELERRTSVCFFIGAGR